MVNKFCIHCGDRLSIGVRFCSSCGARVDEVMESVDPASVKDTVFLDRSGVEREAHASTRAEDGGTVRVMAADLDVLIAFSFMNLPLDTTFLMVLNKQHNWTKWVPVIFIESLQGLEVVGTARVCSIFQAGILRSVEDHLRNPVLPEVAEAFKQLKDRHRLMIDCYPRFGKVSYGQWESMRDQWMTRVDEKSKTYNLMTVVPLSLFCRLMKQRMAEHESMIHQIMPTASESGRAKLVKTLDSLRSAIKEIPDGWPDHMCCIAYALEKKEMVHTVLAEEENSPKGVTPKAEVFRGFPIAASMHYPMRTNPATTTVASRSLGAGAPGRAVKLGSSAW